MRNLNGIKILTKDEMEIVEAGDAHIAMSSSYRNKTTCRQLARRLIDNGKVTGMTQLQIAQEVFAHAVAYYSESTLRDIPGIGDSIADYLVEHAEIVDIADGGDTTIRRAAYSVIWAFMPDEF